MLFRKTIFLLLFLCQIVVGQQLQFDNIGKQLPLPSQECYNIMQDSNGYIWFGTEQGFCRYDGNKLTVFDRNNGLPEGSVYSVAEDKNGKLWLLTSKNRILVFENGKLKEAPFSKKYTSQLSHFDLSYALAFADSGELYINSENHTFTANIETGELKELKTANPVRNFLMLRQKSRVIPLNGFRLIQKTADIKDDKFFDVGLTNGDEIFKKIAIPKGKLITPNMRIVTSNKSKQPYFTISEKLVRIDEHSNFEIFKLPQRILSVHMDRDGGLWLGLLKKGLYYYPNADLSQKPIVGLEDFSVSGILEDKEQNIWCATLEKGLFFCRNKNVVNYFNATAMNRPVDMMHSIDGATYFSTGSKRLVKIANRTVSHYTVGDFSGEPIRDLAHHNGKWFVCGMDVFAETDANFTKIRSLMGNGFYLSVIQLKSVDKRLIGLSVSMIFEWKNEKVVPLFNLKTKLRCFEFLSDGKYLCASNDALYLCVEATKNITKISGIKAPVTKILKTQNNQVWITTKGGGLYQFANGKVVAMNKFLKLRQTILYDIAEYQDDLWIGSNDGLIKISSRSNHFETSVYGILNGLPANEIYKLSVDGKKIFLSTVEGVCSFLPDVDFENTAQPNIFFSGLKVNGSSKPINFIQKTLAHDQNSVQLTFDALAFKSNTTKLWYKLEGREKSFKTNESHTITLDNLPPETYKLTVYALNSDGLKSANPVVLSFEIAKPFWATFWFIGLCIWSIGILVYFGIRNYISRIKSKETEKTRINKLISDSQLSALQAQMNPHFIFNAINSIQNYILKKQEQEAYHYLAKFSKLIRLVLHNSQQQLLPLHEELETVKLYIELEQLRFSDSFDFDLEISEYVDEFEMQIPTMLIQPYLENGIWHGLMNLDGQRRGKITLKISSKNGLLFIEISDNGIGRKLASEYKKENTHQPVAMKLTQQRIEIVNQSYGNGKIRIDVEDFYDPDGNPAGTKVVIGLPINAE